jgi:hypothetical protein
MLPHGLALDRDFAPVARTHVRATISIPSDLSAAAATISNDMGIPAHGTHVGARGG